MPDGKIAPLSRELLRRVVAAGLQERFQFADVVPAYERSRYITGFEALVELGQVERVVVRCGRWHYRLTPAGLTAVKKRVKT